MGHDLALKAASGEPAGRGLCQLAEGCASLLSTERLVTVLRIRLLGPSGSTHARCHCAPAEWTSIERSESDATARSSTNLTTTLRTTTWVKVRCQVRAS